MVHVKDNGLSIKCRSVVNNLGGLTAALPEAWPKSQKTLSRVATKVYVHPTYFLSSLHVNLGSWTFSTAECASCVTVVKNDHHLFFEASNAFSVNLFTCVKLPLCLKLSGLESLHLHLGLINVTWWQLLQSTAAASTYSLDGVHGRGRSWWSQPTH